MKHFLKIFAVVLSISVMTGCEQSMHAFAQWNKERISDNTEWSYYLESYSNGQFVLRHGHKLFTGPCLWDQEAVDSHGKHFSEGEAEISCDQLKSEVGNQLVGTNGLGGVYIETAFGTYIKINDVHSVN